MIDPTALVAFAVLALAGSVHCVGMCGGIALAVSAVPGRAPSALVVRQLSYVTGKAATYAVLALLASTGAAGLVEAATAFLAPALASGLVSVTVGGALLVVGLRHLLGRGSRRSALPLPGVLRDLFARVRALPGSSGSLATGVLNALFPCGLSLAAFGLATTVPPPTAFLGGFLFGLGTAPLLLALGWLPRLTFLSKGPRAATLQGVAWLVTGLLLVGRPLPRMFDSTPDPCCPTGEALAGTGEVHHE